MGSAEERDPLKGAVSVGVDVGQRTDYTALAVVETRGYARLPFNPAPEWFHEVRLLDRLELGMPYPRMALAIKGVVEGVIDRTGGEPPLVYVDATGVGTALVDELRWAGVPARIVPCYFTRGEKRVEREHQNTKQPFLAIAKAWLVTRLQILLQRQAIKLPRTALAQVITDELLNYEIKISEDGDDKYGAFKTGTHDDLVTALGLAVQLDAAPAGHWTESSFKTAAVLPVGF